MQGIADEDLVPEHPDGAVATDAADQEVGWVVEGFDPPGHGLGGGVIELARALHVQAFVRAEVVELPAEAVELALLGG